MRVIVSNALSGLSYGRLLASIASVSILALGIIAVLNQKGIALTVTLPLLIAVLGTIGGILVVGVGGGLIRPMQQRWEDYLSRIEVEGRNVRERRSGRPPEGTADYQDAGPPQTAVVGSSCVRSAFSTVGAGRASHKSLPAAVSPAGPAAELNETLRAK